MSNVEAADVEHAAEVTPEAILQLGLGVLGLEDAAERRRARASSRSWRTRARSMATRCASAWACTRAARRDFFDALVALGMLEREDGRYANTPATDLFLDRAKPSYVGGILEMANARLYRVLGVADRGPADRSRRRTRPRAARTSSRRSTPTRRGWRSSPRR